MAIRVQTDQTIYLYEDEGDTIVPANGAWTIAWMFRFESDLNIGSLLAVMYGDFAATYYCGAYVGANGTTVTLQGGNGTPGPSATGFELEVGRTYRFSLTHDNVGGTVTLANDGVPVLRISFSPAAGTAGFRSLHFGGYGGSPTGHIDATWARMRVWNAVLTAAELKAEFRSATTVKTANLYNDWPMVAGATRLDPASGTTQSIKIHPVPPTVVDGTGFGIEPAELVFRTMVDGSDTTLSNSSVTVPVPTLSNGLSVPVQGDLEFIELYCAVLTGGTPATIAAPAGWTRASPVGTPYTSAGGALSVRGHLFYREAPATPAAAVFSAGGVNSIFVWGRGAYSNANSAALFGQVVFGSGSSASAVLSSLTTTRQRSLFLGWLTQGTAQAAAWPAGTTERLDNAASGSSLADFILPAPGATGTRTVPLPSSTQYGWNYAEFYSQSLTQTLTPSLFSNSQTFYAPTVSRGAVTVSPGLLTNAQSFYAATVTQPSTGQFVLPGLLTNTSSFFAPTIGRGPVSVSPPLVTNGQTFYAASVSVGAVAVLPPLLTNSQSFYGPTITRGAVVLAPSLLTNTSSFFAPVVSAGGSVLQPSLFTNSQTFYAPALSVGAVSIAPGLLSNANQFFGAVVSGGAVLQPPLLVNAQSFFAPAVTAGSVVLLPPLLANQAIFFGPVVGSGAVVNPPLVTNTSSFFTPTVTRGAVTLAPGLLVNQQVFYGPAIVADQFLQAPLLQNTNSIFPPMVIDQSVVIEIDPRFIAKPAPRNWTAKNETRNWEAR